MYTYIYIYNNNNNDNTNIDIDNNDNKCIHTYEGYYLSGARRLSGLRSTVVTAESALENV